MSDVDRERLAVPAAHSVFSQHTGSYSGTSVATAAPPFAPRPHYGQQVRQQRLHSSSAPPPSSTRSTSTAGQPPPSATSSSTAATECTVHEVCYYFQQAVFVVAIVTGVALVGAGAVLHAQNGELLVLVYIGVLLAAVNSVLLTIQCCVRRKQKRRARAYRANARQAQGPPSSAVVRYDPLSNPLLSSTTQTVPADVQQYHYKHYVIHAPNLPQQGTFQDFPPTVQQQGAFAHSPTESASQTRYHHGVPYHRSGSIPGHHRHGKGMQRSPPLGQVHRPLLNAMGQQVNLRSDLCQDSYKSTIPPTYEDLLRSGRLPQDGTTVHLI